MSRSVVQRPGTVAAGLVEPFEPPIELLDLLLGEVARGGEDRPRVGTVHGVEADPVEGEVGGAAEVGHQCRRRGVEPGAGVGLGDVGRVDDVDGVDLDDPAGGAVATARPAPDGASSVGT